MAVKAREMDVRQDVEIHGKENEENLEDLLVSSLFYQYRSNSLEGTDRFELLVTRTDDSEAPLDSTPHVRSFCVH